MGYGARFTHFWAWDLEVSDLNKDGNDDVMILDLQADITTQRVVTYLGPVTSNTQGKSQTLDLLNRILTEHLLQEIGVNHKSVVASVVADSVLIMMYGS